MRIKHQEERKVSAKKRNCMKIAEMENVKSKPQPLNLHLFSLYSQKKEIYSCHSNLRQKKRKNQQPCSTSAAMQQEVEFNIYFTYI